MSSAESDIRDLIHAWAAAVRNQDIEGVLASHSADMLMFDVPPPVAVRGIDDYRATWPPFFRWLSEGEGSFEIAMLDVTAGEDVAYATALIRCASKAELARDDAPQLRLTVGLRKDGDAWKIAHQHHSFPASSE